VPGARELVVGGPAVVEQGAVVVEPPGDPPRFLARDAVPPVEPPDEPAGAEAGRVRREGGFDRPEGQAALPSWLVQDRRDVRVLWRHPLGRPGRQAAQDRLQRCDGAGEASGPPKCPRGRPGASQAPWRAGRAEAAPGAGPPGGPQRQGGRIINYSAQTPRATPPASTTRVPAGPAPGWRSGQRGPWTRPTSGRATARVRLPVAPGGYQVGPGTDRSVSRGGTQGYRLASPRGDRPPVKGPEQQAADPPGGGTGPGRSEWTARLPASGRLPAHAGRGENRTGSTGP
jgi:hypothetical protein